LAATNSCKWVALVFTVVLYWQADPVPREVVRVGCSSADV
jgi:hypothetical protein